MTLSSSMAAQFAMAEVAALALLAAIAVATLVPADGRSARAALAGRAFPRLFRRDHDLLPRLAPADGGGGGLLPVAVLLEALQGLTPDRTPDLPTALSAAAGVASAALLADLVICAAEGRGSARIRAESLTPGAGAASQM